MNVIEELPSGAYLNYESDQLYSVRKLFNLENPERIQEAIKILKDWLQKQDYFNKRDFSDGYFERLLILSKGSVERAKSCFDKLCTFRTIWPQYFTVIDVNSFKTDFKLFNALPLPDVTKEYARVVLFKINSDVPLQPDILSQCIKYSVIVIEYLKMLDYPNGFVFMLDYQDVNLLDLIAVLSPSLLQQMVALYTEGYGIRLRGIHLITTSKVADGLVSLIKQVMSKKLGSRIQLHRKFDTLYEYIPKKILPAEYGGDAAALKEMLGNFLKELGSEEHKKYMKEVQSSTIDLSKKPKDTIDDYINMAGSFRTLNVD